MPKVSTHLTLQDHLGTLGARTGFQKNSYKITPGLYAIGKPNENDPIAVTANYKLTFDTIRAALSTLNIWLLVIDTRGINVWCAAGKGTFSTEEIVYQVLRTRLQERVNHKTLILPQLGASGISLVDLPKQCGFNGVYGPIRIDDLPTFLDNDLHATESIRSVTFTLQERLPLIPVEICSLLKKCWLPILTVTILSGIGPNVFSIPSALDRSMLFLVTSLLAVFIGSVLTPVFLPIIPGRQFWVKGSLMSIPGLLFLLFLYGNSQHTLTLLALGAWLVSLSSYLAMKFTGSTPYTSLSGVEKEMRKGLPWQVGLILIATISWVVVPFFT